MHEPILTFYLDEVIASEAHLGDDAGLAFAAYNHFCDRELTRSYVFGAIDGNLPFTSASLRDGAATKVCQRI